MAERDAPSRRTSPRRNALEWAVFAVGALLTAGVVGWLGYDALRGGADRPDLRVSLGAPAERHAQVVVPVRVTNDGGATGEDVRVEVCRGSGAGEECAEVAFDFVARGSYREGEVGFREGRGPFAARVLSALAP